MAYRDTIQAEGTLLHYFPMDEGTGATALAALVGGASLTLGTTTAKPTGGVTGQVDGTCFSFDGGDFAQSAANIDLSAQSKIVVEFLMWWDAFADTDKLAMEFTANAGSNSGGFAFNPNSSSPAGRLVVFADGNSGLTSASFTRPTAAAWHLYHIEIDFGLATNEVALYIDGALQTVLSRPSNSNNTNTFANSKLNLFSRNASSLFGAGRMQHLAIYSALADLRKTAHYDEAFASPATAYTLTGPSGGSINVASTNFTVTPNGTSSAVVTIARSGGGLTGSQTVTFDGTIAAKTFTITPTAMGTVTLTPSDNGGLTDPANVTYAVDSGVIAVANGDLWYQGGDNSAAPRQSACAEVRVVTDATTFKVTGTTSVFGSFPSYAELVVLVDGVAQTPNEFAANGQQTFTIGSLGSSSKSIIVRTGILSNPSGTVLGTFIDSFQCLGVTTYSVTAPVNTNRVLVYGDSITVGANADVPATHGWAALLRDTYLRKVMLEAHGFRSLHDDIGTTGTLDTTKSTAFASKIAGYAPARIIFAIGTNDYGLNKWTAANFGTALADLLDRIHVALPAVPVLLISPIQRISPAVETANVGGSTLGNYRTQISTVASARSSYCQYLNGAAGAIVPDAQYDADGIHLATTGQATYAAAINQYAATYTLSIPSTGTAGVEMTGLDFDYDIVASGGETITINDGGAGGFFSNNGGTVTGTGSVTFTATAAGTHQVFKYTPAAAGSVTLNFSNGQGWTGPATAGITVGAAASGGSPTSGGGAFLGANMVVIGIGDYWDGDVFMMKKSK